MHGEVERAHAPVALLRIGHCHGKVAAEADQRLGPAIGDGLHRRHRVVAMLTRRFEAEDPLDAFQHGGGRFLGNADRAVSLHIGMAAQRADACPWFSEISTQQQQVCDLLDV